MDFDVPEPTEARVLNDNLDMEFAQITPAVEITPEPDSAPVPEWQGQKAARWGPGDRGGLGPRRQYSLSLSEKVDLKKLRFFTVPPDGGSVVTSPISSSTSRDRLLDPDAPVDGVEPGRAQEAVLGRQGQPAVVQDLRGENGLEATLVPHPGSFRCRSTTAGRLPLLASPRVILPEALLKRDGPFRGFRSVLLSPLHRRHDIMEDSESIYSPCWSVVILQLN
ncbi:unnamed protein product [Gadus morhua 'NCC']